MTSGAPLIRVRSRRFQTPDDYPFFEDRRIVWHMVMNPVYAAKENAQAAILTAEVDRDSETAVRIAEEPRLDMAEAKRDLRRLMTVEMGVLMENGNMRLTYLAGTAEADGHGETAVFDHPLGLQLVPTKTYKVKDTYYMIVGYSTMREIPDDLPIHVGFYLYPTTHNSFEQHYFGLSTTNNPDLKYTSAPTTDYDKAGNTFTPIAGIPDVSGDGVWIAHYIRGADSPSERDARKKQLAETELPRIIQEFASKQAEDVGDMKTKKIADYSVVLKRGDGLNVWFGILKMDVNYLDTIDDKNKDSEGGEDAKDYA
ncbi:hypothetical protein G6011_06589 [Alternaria panax]|uniref:Uncharacterized protein n=1 Tax=Alternaria panax TaxID=48097 RepID=A0AAD4FJM8_9PLEO|nr:hypothetical protein G6011_06589 [Alternaria panax]